MFPRKLIALSLVAVLALFVGITQNVDSSRAQGSLLAPNSPLGTAFTYQGQLKDSAGNPISDNCGFRFTLYDADVSGAQVGPIQEKTAVAVTGGYFTVVLDFGSAAFTGEARWLEVAVKCSGEADYTSLSPRQSLTPAPYASYAPAAGNADLLDNQHATAFAGVTHTHVGEDITSGTVADARIASSLARDSEIMPTVLANDGSGSGLDADLLDGQQGAYYLNASNINAGTLGTGYFSAYSDLSAEGYLDLSAGGDLLTRDQGDARYVTGAHTHWGQSWSGSGTGLTLSGGTTGLSGSGSTYGVYGISSSTTGFGVEGTNNATSGYTVGVYGASSSPSGYGVYGNAGATSGNTYGVYGVSSSSAGTGVYGYTSATSGITYGVFGAADSTNGFGVFGVEGATSGTTYGVYGLAYSTTGAAGYFSNASGSGTTRGWGVRAFTGSGGSGDVHPGGGFLNAAGEFAGPNGVIGAASSDSSVGYGVIGLSAGTNGVGVFAEASATSGSTYGVYAESYSASGTGVYGYASTYGVYGSSYSTSGTGVYGYAPASSGTTYGVYGRSDSTSGYGMYGYAYGGTGVTSGVYGQEDSYDGFGVAGHAYWGGVGVGAWSYSGNLIEAYNGDYPYGTLEFYITGSGNVFTNGTYNTFKASNLDGATHAVSAIQSPEVWVEDFGRANLVDGMVVVTIAPDFAGIANLSVDYNVFLTPMGDSLGLYATNLTPTSFEVHEQNGGKSNITFSYRIVAKQAGSETIRLPEVTIPATIDVPRQTPDENQPVEQVQPQQQQPAEPVTQPAAPVLPPVKVQP